VEYFFSCLLDTGGHFICTDMRDLNDALFDDQMLSVKLFLLIEYNLLTAVKH